MKICRCSVFQYLVLTNRNGRIGRYPRLKHSKALQGFRSGAENQKMTYHLCAEDMTKSAIVPNLPEEERRDLMEHGILPQESSTKDRFCVMCPVKRGSPRLHEKLPCCLCYNWCHICCSYQTHLGRVCPYHVQILDLKRKIIVLRHPYHEDCVVLPTRNTTRPDAKSIDWEVEYRTQRDDTSLSRWSHG